MNNLLVENFKTIMVYIRNYPDDSDLCQMLLALEDAIQNSDNDIIVERISCVRVLSDQMFRSIIYDLAVLPEYQHKGIGKELVRRCRETFPNSE